MVYWVDRVLGSHCHCPLCWLGLRRALFVVWVVLSGICAADAVETSNQHDAEQRLAQTRDRLQSVSQERQQLERLRGQAVRRLRDADARVARSVHALNQSQTALQQQQLALEQVRKMHSMLHEQLNNQRHALEKIVQQAYVFGPSMQLQLLLAQDNALASNRMFLYAASVQAALRQRLDDLLLKAAVLAKTQAQMDSQQQALLLAEHQYAQQMQTVQMDRKTQAAAVSALESQYQDQRVRENALVQDASALERLVARLRSAARANALKRARASASNRNRPSGSAVDGVTGSVQVGGLGWPVTGALLAGYGALLPDGHQSKGLFIAAPSGTPVMAVADGTIVFADWMTGYGMIVIIDHGNGYMSLYAHNETLLQTVNAPIRQGEVIAKVGNSGGLKNAGLYFELRHHGQPVDPVKWLHHDHG